MALEVILEVKYAIMFKYQFEYILKNKDIIQTLHIINETNDQALVINFHLLKIKYSGWIKIHTIKNDRFDYIDKNFNSNKINYIFISKFICWQSKDFFNLCNSYIDNSNEVLVPQIFNTERIIYLHQIFGFLKTFTFRPWDDEYIDDMRPDTWPDEVYHYLHNNYLKLIQNDAFEKINFNKYYFNKKEIKPEFLFCWCGSIKNKKWYIKGDLFSSIISPNEKIFNFISESSYLDQYEFELKKQFEPMYIQLKLNLDFPDEPKDHVQLSFEFEEEIIDKIETETIKFAINSNINQNKKIINTLVTSLLKNNILSQNIVVFIGGSKESKREIIDGIVYQYVEHNSFDHTAIIGIVEEDYHSDYWMILHDTSEAGKNFYNNLLKHPKSKFSAVLEDGWLNMGLFSNEFISNNSNYILSLKDCNKMRAILSEQIYSRLGDSSYINSRIRTQLKGKTVIYNDGIERLIIYFADLDLYKYQSYHYNSEYTKQLREKYFIDIHKLT